MDKIQKFLARLSPKERGTVRETIQIVLSGNTQDLDIKKLKGFDDIFRVRVQSIRIIYQKRADTIQIIEISRRNEDTYKNF